VKKDPRVYLAHILECAQKIERYTKGGEKEFHNDTMLQDAVIRNLGLLVKRRNECLRLTAERILRFHGVSWPVSETF
jgi:uncharacterized protein with HEPN domain